MRSSATAVCGQSWSSGAETAISLALADYPCYIGLDVSASAIMLCKRRFADDQTKSFLLYDGECFVDHAGLFTAE